MKRGYAIISPDIGQHTLQHTNWLLMGERVWDALRCLDYFETPGREPCGEVLTT